jgi:hypothetical protein
MVCSHSMRPMVSLKILFGLYGSYYSICNSVDESKPNVLFSLASTFAVSGGIRLPIPAIQPTAFRCFGLAGVNRKNSAVQFIRQKRSSLKENKTLRCMALLLLYFFRRLYFVMWSQLQYAVVTSIHYRTYHSDAKKTGFNGIPDFFEVFETKIHLYH